MTRERTEGYRRLIYTSVARSADFLGILRESRRNNGIDGVSGLLVYDGQRFTQVLEGPPGSVEHTYSRIQFDERHRDLIVLSDTIEAERAFSDWAMAGLPGDDEEMVRDSTRRMLRRVPPEVQQAFEHV